MPLRKLESDAERCCGRDRCHSGGFLLRIMPPSWYPVPACAPRLCCRRAILCCRYESWNRTRKIVAATATAGGPFSAVATDIRIGRGDLCRYDRSRRNHSSLPQPRLESDAERSSCATFAAGIGATPAAFYLGLCAFVASCSCLHPTTALQAGRSSLSLRN